MKTRPPCIIGFSGRKGSGKNTCADFITAHIYGSKSLSVAPTVQTYAFADPMKRMCMQFFGLTHDQCYGTNEQKNSFTILRWEDFPVVAIAAQHDGFMSAREVLQFFGTEILRKMYMNTHVQALMYDIDHDECFLAQITDVRFPNEVAGIQARGGKVIRLTRVIYSEDQHESETALDPENYDWNNFDYILDNADLDLTQQKNSVLNLINECYVTL